MTKNRVAVVFSGTLCIVAGDIMFCDYS